MKTWFRIFWTFNILFPLFFLKNIMLRGFAVHKKEKLWFSHSCLRFSSKRLSSQLKTTTCGLALDLISTWSNILMWWLRFILTVQLVVFVPMYPILLVHVVAFEGVYTKKRRTVMHLFLFPSKSFYVLFANSRVIRMCYTNFSFEINMVLSDVVHKEIKCDHL